MGHLIHISLLYLIPFVAVTASIGFFLAKMSIHPLRAYIRRNTENANMANNRQGMVRLSVCSGLVLYRMKNPRFSALLALVWAASIGSLQAATPPTRIMSAQVITTSGSYILANDITGNIDIQASDVSVNGSAHRDREDYD